MPDLRRLIPGGGEDALPIGAVDRACDPIQMALQGQKTLTHVGNFTCFLPLLLRIQSPTPSATCKDPWRLMEL